MNNNHDNCKMNNNDNVILALHLHYIAKRFTLLPQVMELFNQLPFQLPKEQTSGAKH